MPVHPQSNTSVTGVEDKAAGDSKLNDSPGCNYLYIKILLSVYVLSQPTSKVSITDEKTATVSYAANWFPPNSVELVVTLYKVYTGISKSRVR